LTDRPPARRLALAVTLALSLSVFVMALLGPAQTLAQTHRAACSGAAHAKAKHGAHACTQSSRKIKAKTKRRSKHASVKKTRKRSSAASQAMVPARCEDGSTPVREAGGSFVCEDGSEPQCEDGATPTVSRNGKSLVCAVPAEGEASASESECEEESLGCSTGSGSGEQTCEAADGDSGSACEGES
jgi:hypothetical protein